MAIGPLRPAADTTSRAKRADRAVEPRLLPRCDERAGRRRRDADLRREPPRGRPGEDRVLARIEHRTR